MDRLATEGEGSAGVGPLAHIMHFMVSRQRDVGISASGLLIGLVILLYAFFSETMIKGMTAGAARR